MSEPLFLQSVMQEKIWGGTKLRDEFGYDIPSEKIGEYWAISAHPNGVSKVANGRYEGTDLATLYAEHRELFGNRPEPVFPLLTKILDANDWLSVQVHPDDAYGLARRRARKNRVLVHHRSRRRFRDYLRSQCQVKRRTPPANRGQELGCLADKSSC